jgi:hypothetical protein
MIVAGDYTIVAGTLAKAIYDELTASFGTPAAENLVSFTDSKKKAAAAIAAAVALRANADLIDAGGYTPVFTSVGNIAAVGTTQAHLWARFKGSNADVVAVSGAKGYTPTAAGQCDARMTVPVATNFSSSSEARGPISAAIATFQGGGTFADTATDEVNLRWFTSGTTAHNITYCYLYEVH